MEKAFKMVAVIVIVVLVISVAFLLYERLTSERILGSPKGIVVPEGSGEQLTASGAKRCCTTDSGLDCWEFPSCDTCYLLC